MTHPSRPLLPALLLGALLASAPAIADETIVLSNGDAVTGEVISRDDQTIVLEHEALGRITIPVEALKPPDELPGLFGTGLLEGWKRSLDLGLSGSEGNTQEAAFRIGLEMSERTDERRWKVSGAYKLSTNSGSIDDHNGRLSGRRDWLLPDSDWFWFTGSEYQYDEFESWEHRVSAQVGRGYHFYEAEPFWLDALAGFRLAYEFGDRDELRPEVFVGVELTWDVRLGHELIFSNYIYPQLNAAELRNVTRAKWKMRLLGSEHLSLLLGFDNEYDTAADDSRNNLKYYTSLSYQY